MPHDETPRDGTTMHQDDTEVMADITAQTPARESPENDPSATENTAETSLPEDPALLRARLEEANRRAAAEHEAYLRARADFANYKRRMQEDAVRQREILNENLLLHLLPVMDNFERALQSAQTTREFDKLLEGVNLILRQMQDFMAKEGITVIEAVGQPFDPSIHNAVMRQETTEYPENTVVEELQKGYTLGERVLRPSMVKVATEAE